MQLQNPEAESGADEKTKTTDVVTCATVAAGISLSTICSTPCWSRGILRNHYHRLGNVRSQESKCRLFGILVQLCGHQAFSRMATLATLELEGPLTTSHLLLMKTHCKKLKLAWSCLEKKARHALYMMLARLGVPGSSEIIGGHVHTSLRTWTEKNRPAYES